MSLTQDEARKELRRMFRPGTTIYTVLRHVSSSGMSRAISVIHQGKDGPQDVSWLAAKATGFKLHRRYEGLSVGGCGMDMGFHVAYSLSRALYPDGFNCIQYDRRTGRDKAGDNRRKWCPSNDHSNGLCGWGHHSDGGYALRHRWL
jgi:hypothetical protein